jgi:branched-chain amino acid transport system ATP-binding protein
VELRLDGISAGYGRVEVLHAVDVVVPEGSVVALLGANGAGKSTLLRVAAGLVPARQGRVLLDGEDVSNAAVHARAAHGLCLIPEGRAIFRHLTVRENLAMQVGGRGVDEAVTRAVAVFPRLTDRLGQVAGTMSGGEQQMLAVARALVTDPTLVMADELSVGLAPVIVDEIFAAVDALRAVGVSLLIVEQYVERVLELADYVYVLHKGAVSFVGEPSQCRGSLFEQYMGGIAS